MALKVAQRGLVEPFIVMDVMREANKLETAGKEILHLEVGQPAQGAPKGVIKTIKHVLGEKLGYTEAFGIGDLRKRIAQYYFDYYGIDISPRQVAITTGSSAAFVLSFVAAFEVGDKVALAAPGYPAYRNILKALGVDVIEIATGPETNFQPNIDLVKKLTNGVDGLILASPSNPAGTMLSGSELSILSDFCADSDIRIISDEIYHGITYVERARTIAEYSKEAIIVNSFSKYFSMTGWRVGWCVLPEDLIRPLECLAQNFFISPPTLSQHAALASFDCTNELDENVEKYAVNRKILLDQLPRAGFNDLSSAEGAFYIYANVESITSSSSELCKKMLEEIGVAATPGIDFDQSRGQSYVRFSYSESTEKIAEAARRLVAWKK